MRYNEQLLLQESGPVYIWFNISIVKMKNIIFTLMVLLIVNSCAGHREIVDKSCKIQNEGFELKDEFKGGARSQKSIKDTLMQKMLVEKTLGVVVNTVNRSLHRNNISEGKYKLVFNLYISGTGKVVDIETAYSDFESCDLLKRIYKNYYEINFGEIDNKHDISIFQQRFDFFSDPNKRKGNSRTIPSDTVPGSISF